MIYVDWRLDLVYLVSCFFSSSSSLKGLGLSGTHAAL